VPTKASLDHIRTGLKWPNLVTLTFAEAAVVRYAAYARHFHWTPQQVDALPLTADRYLLPIRDIFRELESEKDGS
jgi:hypothetical protein